MAILGSCHKKNIDSFGFSAGVHPIEYSKKYSLKLLNSDKRVTTSRDCKACHEQVYKNWFASRHRVSFSNQLYQEAHAREPLAWCINCHAPFIKPGADINAKKGRVQAEDGISCITCHVREGRVMVSSVPEFKGAPEHEYLVREGMANESFCASCHQFNFPTRQSMKESLQKGSPIRYSHLVMQDTVNEYRRSGFFQKLTCQTCHLLGRSEKSHTFSGGHDLALLKQSLKVRARRISPSRIVISVYAIGIGHSFPTGDLFRSLRLYLSSPNEKEIEEIVLHKLYKNVLPKNQRPNAAAKYLAKDTTIGPPAKGEYTSRREFVITWRDHRPINYRLHMDYLFGFNHVTTRLKHSKTTPLIKSGQLAIANH